MVTKKRALTYFTWVLYACAILQFIRYYIVTTYFYLDMSRYLSGRERLPFQERVLPIFLMWPINHSSFVMRHLVHRVKVSLRRPRPLSSRLPSMFCRWSRFRSRVF